MTLIGPDELAELEVAVAHAFESCDTSALRILGYGEISSVVAWQTRAGVVATKRLPPFPDRGRFEAYAASVRRYLGELEAGGIDPVATEVHAHQRADGAIVGYCVQPILAPDTLLPRVFSTATSDDVTTVFAILMDRILGFMTGNRGLDAQLSNWTYEDGRVAYLDVSTPLLREPDGTEVLDGDLFMASLPWALRPIVRRFMLQDILDKYYDPRGVVVDLLGNLHKERLERFLPALIAIANQRLDGPAITETEVARYYRGDARSWALLQRLRRADRAWQRGVRRRPYPFLLPGPIER